MLEPSPAGSIIPRIRRRALLGSGAAWLFCAMNWPASPLGAEKAKPAAPTWAAIEGAISRAFAGRQDYQADDLISQTEFDLVVKELDRVGWVPQDADEIRKQLFSPKAFMVTQLARPAGKKFMRQISRFPDGYDRLDRLSQLSNGRDMVERLIKGPDGYKLIEYLATTSGGREMGQMLSDAPRGGNFNKPTGRIYTADELTARLKDSYEQSASRAR